MVGGGVKIIGLPWSAGDHAVGALHESITLPDCPANAGTTVVIAKARAIGTRRISALQPFRGNLSA